LWLNVELSNLLLLQVICLSSRLTAMGSQWRQVPMRERAPGWLGEKSHSPISGDSPRGGPWDPEAQAWKDGAISSVLTGCGAPGLTPSLTSTMERGLAVGGESGILCRTLGFAFEEASQIGSLI
jgi:hypothetical protein